MFDQLPPKRQPVSHPLKFITACLAGLLLALGICSLNKEALQGPGLMLFAASLIGLFVGVIWLVVELIRGPN